MSETNPIEGAPETDEKSCGGRGFRRHRGGRGVVLLALVAVGSFALGSWHRSCGANSGATPAAAAAAADPATPATAAPAPK